MQNTSNNVSVSLDSIAVCVEDMEKAAAFLTDVMGWKRHPMQFTVNQETERSNSKVMFVDGNGAWLQLVSTEYPVNSPAQAKCNGTFSKLNFSTDHCEELQKRITNATTTEHQRIPVDVYEKSIEGGTNLISQRDQDWDHHEADGNVPRIDRVAIIVENNETSVDFYTDVLGLKLHPMKFGIDASSNEDIGGFKPCGWRIVISPKISKSW